jgi:hypothetical protein
LTATDLLLGPILGQLGDVHDEDQDVMAAAVLLVEIAADGLALQDAGQAGFFPGFLQGNLAGRLARLEVPFRDDPSLTAAGGDKADTAVANGNGSRLPDQIDVDSHQGIHPGPRSLSIA